MEYCTYLTIGILGQPPIMIYSSGNEPVCETTQYIHDLHNVPSYSPSGYDDTTALLALELEPWVGA